MGIINMAEMRETREERRRYEEDIAARERAAEERKVTIRLIKQKKNESLLRATNKLLQQDSTDADIHLLLSELSSWKELLLKVDSNTARNLINVFSYVPAAIQVVLRPFLPIFQLKIFKFTDDIIQRSELCALHSLIEKSNYLLVNMQINEFPSLLITLLSDFIDKIDNESLDEKQILCLQRIVNDYQIHLLGSHNSIDNIAINHLMASSTLGQLNPKQILTQGLAINVINFASYCDSFKKRLALLPLNIETKATINNVILPGITALINDEDAIVAHVKNNHGMLYYLNDKLPIHTDHVSSSTPEEYRHTLRRLLSNFFGAAEIAYNKGCLHLFCEKISNGYCFEGRVSSVFSWITDLSDVVSFHETMEQYIQKEYLPYAQTMNNHIHDVFDADLIIDFIMARHKNALCLYDAQYAPNNEVTLIGVKKYLADIFALISQKDCEQALKQARQLRGSLERSISFFGSQSKTELMQTKIDALKRLETLIEIDKESPALAATKVKEQYPRALYSYYFNSRTKQLLTQLEHHDNEFKCGK